MNWQALLFCFFSLCPTWRVFGSEELLWKAYRAEDATSYSTALELYRDFLSQNPERDNRDIVQRIARLEEQRSLLRQKETEARRQVTARPTTEIALQQAVTELLEAAEQLKGEEERACTLHNLAVCLADLQAIPGLITLPPDAPRLRLLEEKPVSEEQLYLKACLLPSSDRKQVKAAYQAVYQQFPKGKFAEAGLHSLATWLYRKNEWTEAKDTWKQLVENFPSSEGCAESLYWMARCAEQLSVSPKEYSLYYQEIVQRFPSSPRAPEAYLHRYPWEQYRQGQEESLSHLTRMAKHFPQSAELIVAQYLLGLAELRGGTGHSERSLERASAYFQEVDSLCDKVEIPAEQRSYYLRLQLRAALERAMINRLIAQQSQGTKRHIYEEYARTSYQELLRALLDTEGEIAKTLDEPMALCDLQNECSLGYAQLLKEAGEKGAADQILSDLIQRSEASSVHRSYYLAKAHSERAGWLLAHQPLAALVELTKAEEASRGGLLSTDERLEIWIEQSQAHSALGHFDQAMHLLSQVVNDDCVSPLRLKAMLLRAEVYERDGRMQLARNQLLSLSRKGGEWAQKAKEKLGRDYGYTW